MFKACPFLMSSSKFVLLVAVFTFVAPTNVYAQCGKASWYAMTSKTASGQRANPGSMTAAHRTLPLGTKVRVTNLRNGKSAVVRINDRGPFVKGRIIDLTEAVATKLGFRWAGWTRVGISREGKRFAKGRVCRELSDGASLLPLEPAKPKPRPSQAQDFQEVTISEVE